MTPEQQAKLKTTISEVVKRIRPEIKDEIKATDRLKEDLGLDSLQSMELLSVLTEEYDIDVDIEEVQDVSTIADVTAFLERAVTS